MDPLPDAMLSSIIAASTAPGSHTSIRLMGSRLWTGSSNPLSMPMPWPTGAPTRSGGLPVCMDASCSISKQIVRCECTTPLGSAVVPEV